METKVENKQCAISRDGVMYIIDKEKKTCRRLYKPSKDTFEELANADMDMRIYQRYLKDKFPEDDCPIKNGALKFRGYRISCTAEAGFLIEDTLSHYEPVGAWEEIPTPEELVGHLVKKVDRKPMTSKEVKEAMQRGQDAYDKRKAEYAEKTANIIEVDYEKLRKSTLKLIAKMSDGKSEVAIEDLIISIPFKRWRRKAKALYKELTEKKIRKPKFFTRLRTITEEETFEIVDKNHRSDFKGTIQPIFTKVGGLIGNKIEVDGILIDAVQFLVQYLLSLEPRCMSQIMKFSRGEITINDMLAEPLKVDWKEEYKQSILENTADNAMAISLMFDAVGLVAPQDLLYESSLKVGDVIMLWFEDEGVFKRRTVATIEGGVTVGRECGLLKTDKWIMAPVKNA